MTGGQAVVRSLKAEKVEHMFGLIGSATIEVFDALYIGADISSPPFDKVAELYGAKGFSVERTSEISEAVNAALKCGKPAVVDIAVDPKALYSFRRDSFKHRQK